jgi:hypothetical protein
MIQAASSPSGLFDEGSFVNALTNDIKAWDASVEKRESTYVFDVFQESSIRRFNRAQSQENTASHGSPTIRRPKTSRDHNATNDGDYVRSRLELGHDADNVHSDSKEGGKSSSIQIQASSETGQKGSPAFPSKAEEVPDIENKSSELNNSATVELHTTWSGVVIDFVVDSFSSFSVLILIWTVFLCSAASYGSL